MLLPSIFLAGYLFFAPPVAPVEGRVIQQFIAPACQRCAGHRGITVLTAVGGAVLASADGEITFSGTVAGRVFVVQSIASGVRMTYGWLLRSEPSLKVGQKVTAGHVLGQSGRSTYLGVRVGVTYVDPLRYLQIPRPHLVGPSGAQLAKVGRLGPTR